MALINYLSINVCIICCISYEKRHPTCVELLCLHYVIVIQCIWLYMYTDTYSRINHFSWNCLR